MQTLHEHVKRPKASRMEKQVRNWGRALLLVTLSLLVVTIGMTARYGWNTTPGDYFDKAQQATINGIVDLAGPIFAGLFGICVAHRYRLWGAILMILTLLCAGYTYQAIVGFRSSSTETLAHARSSALGLSDRYMTWATDTVTKRLSDEKGQKGKQEALESGIAAIGQQVKDQIRLLQSGDLAAPDGQAATFARMFNTSEANARSWTASLTAFLVVVICYGSAAACGFLRQQLEPAVVALAAADSRQFTGGKTGIVGKSHEFTKSAAREDLDRLLVSGGLSLSKRGVFSQLARRWGWTVNKTIRWLYDQDDLVASLPRKSRTNVVALNGNGRAHA